ncbi:MAG: hypothetical protein ACJATV_000987 [Granulosicoccus sp.]|jgi:hypothetical protein
MQIIDGDLRYHGSSHGAGLYVPSGPLLSHGWGMGRSSHVTGETLKSLPDKLDITFYSYWEDQFYRGSFDLPYDTILRLFREAEAQPKRRAMDGSERPNTYMIIVGVAPGGTVAVWMRGWRTKEIFFGKAEKVDIDFAQAFRVPIADKAERTEYVNETIMDEEIPPEKLAAIRKNGIPFDQWANYRMRYNWVPTFAVSNPPQKISISFYTGEGESFQYPLEPYFTGQAQPMPESFRFSYTVSGQVRGYYYEVDLDEAEVVSAFARLSAKKLPMQLEITPAKPIEQTQIRLHNGEEAISLKNFTVK